MEMMTRRSFLKITGAMALAVGAAGALSGCDAVDNALGSFFQQYGDQKGHAADSAKIDGHKAKVVLDPEKAANVSGLGDYTPLFDANGTKTYGPGKNLNKAEAGYICFQPVYDEGEAHVNKKWGSLEFTFKLKGNTSTFVMNRNADGSITSARK